MFKNSSLTPQHSLAAAAMSAVAILTITAGAHADFVIQPTATGTSADTFTPTKAVNGAGLSDPTLVETNDAVPSTWPTHTVSGSGSTTSGVTNNSDQWRVNSSDAAIRTLTLDLGAVYALNGAYIWNYGEIFNNVYQNARSAKDITFSFSLDNATYGAAVPFTLARTPDTTTYAGEAKSFAAPVNARYVKLNVVNNYAANNFAGIAEVRFTSVPEPTTAVTMLGGLGLLGMLRRRHRAA